MFPTKLSDIKYMVLKLYGLHMLFLELDSPACQNEDEGMLTEVSFSCELINFTVHDWKFSILVVQDNIKIHSLCRRVEGMIVELWFWKPPSFSLPFIFREMMGKALLLQLVM